MKIRLLITALAISSTFWLGCEENKPQSRADVETFKVEVLNDTVPSEVQVIIKITINGYVETNIYHEGAYTALENGMQTNSSSFFASHTVEHEYTDTLSLFYFDAGQYEIKLETMGQEYKDNFTLYNKQ